MNTAPRPSFDDDDLPDAHEHGERPPAQPREESLIGTAGSHTPAPDARAGEPFDELAAVAADAEGSDG